MSICLYIYISFCLPPSACSEGPQPCHLPSGPKRRGLVQVWEADLFNCLCLFVILYFLYRSGKQTIARIVGKVISIAPLGSAGCLSFYIERDVIIIIIIVMLLIVIMIIIANNNNNDNNNNSNHNSNNTNSCSRF